MFKKTVSAVSAILMLLSVAAFPTFAEGQQTVTKTVITAQNVQLSKTRFTYNGKTQAPQVKVTVGEKELTAGTDYTVRLQNNTEIGKAEVIIDGIGDYNGTVLKSFSVIPQKAKRLKLSSQKVMELTAKWGAVKKATGYQMQYSKSKSFKKADSVWVYGKTTASARGMTAGKYYVRVRAFFKKDGKKTYGDYNSYKIVNVKKPKYKTSKKNVICLTFDDGPSSNVTPRVLNTLKRNNVKATFFIINYSKENKKLVKRIINDGHTLGIHCYSHDYAKIYRSEAEFMRYYNKLAKKIKKDFNYDVKVMRFPGGSSNMVSTNYCSGVMTALTKRMNKKGIAYFDWNVSSEDAAAVTAARSRIYKASVYGLRKKRTNVVLMHDASTKTTTASALQSVIDYGYNNGYVFRPITDKTPAVHHAVAN